MKERFVEYNQLESYDSTPKVGGLMISFRSIGYSVETAIADLVDNCIAAEANMIHIYFDWSSKKVYVADNGKGMDKKQLLEAMNLATGDPMLMRRESDLGRFGMGMKTASFSMGKNLLVISRKDKEIANAFWDIDYVIKEGKWKTLSWNNNAIDQILAEVPLCLKYFFMLNGTMLIISQLDKLVDEKNAEKSKSTFYETIESVKEHLSLHFHRFMEEDGLRIYVNDNLVEPWNPFVRNNVATQELPIEEYNFNGRWVRIEPYILPHETKFVLEKDFYNAGRGDWDRYQGFYIYRNKRLIEYGTWFRKLKKEPAYRLARIKLDISSDSDGDWKIDVLKSKVSLPAYLRDIIVRIASEASRKSLEIYNSRGTYTKGKTGSIDTEFTYVWEQRRNSSGQYSYYLNKRHPLLKKLIENMEDETSSVLKVYLKLIESYMPAIMSGMVANLNKDNNVNVSNDLRNIDVMEVKQLIASFREAGINDDEIITLIRGMKQYSYLRNNVEKIVRENEDE